MRNLVIRIVSFVLRFLETIAPSLAEKLAFGLFCYPTGRTRVWPQEQKTIDKSQLSMISINDNDICVYRWGNGVRPILLLHGWESRAARYSSLIEMLLGIGYSPVAFDAPGHGESTGKFPTILDYRDISQTLADEFGPFEAIIAHSFGVLCAFYAIKQGITTQRIIAISGVSQFQYLRDEFCHQLGISSRLKARLTRRIEAFFHPAEQIWERFSVMTDSDDINVPIMCIHDPEDDIANFQQALHMKAHFGDQMQLVEAPGLGHRGVLRDPFVIEKIRSFIH